MKTLNSRRSTTGSAQREQSHARASRGHSVGFPAPPPTNFLLEQGVHGIVRRSGIDDVFATILSAKFIVATCRVETSSIATTQ
jgi:hypothetical protein